MSVSDLPSQTVPFLVIYQSRAKAVRIIIGSLVFLVGSIFIYLTPFNGDDDLIGRTAHVLAAYGGPPIFTLMLLWSVKQFLSKKPLLIFDDRGITTRGYGLIPWTAIAAVGSSYAMRRRVFAIYARDIEILASQYPEAKAKNMRFNQENMGMATGIGELSLPMTVEQLVASVGGYCDERIRNNP